MTVLRIALLSLVFLLATPSNAGSLVSGYTKWTDAKLFLEASGYEVAWRSGCSVEFGLTSQVCAEGFTALAGLTSPSEEELHLLMFFDSNSILKVLTIRSELSIEKEKI